MKGAKKLCKYDEIGKIPSENLHPIPGAQSQSGLESGPENPIRRPAAAHCTPSIRACTSYTLILGAFPKNKGNRIKLSYGQFGSNWLQKVS